MTGRWKNLPVVLQPRRSAAILMDKSAIQALSRDEMEAISVHDLHLNVPPILLREVLADVAKTYKRGRDPIPMVQSLAEKVGGFHSTINVDYRETCAVELVGAAQVPLAECGILAADATLSRRDGQSGVLIDQRRWQAVIENWKRGAFDQADMAWADRWRTANQSFRRQELFSRLQRHRVVLPKVETVEECFATVDDLLKRAALQQVWLDYILGELRLVVRLDRAVRARWARETQWLENFAPYSCFCLRVMLAVASASKFRLIRWEPTTILDATYLYYLPFCEIFVSNDHVHERLAPAMLNPHQRFLTARAIKPELAPLAAEWRKRQGRT